jgi:hypothetical protein
MMTNKDKQVSNVYLFVVNVSNTRTAFAGGFLPFSCRDGLSPPTRLSLATRSHVYRIHPAVRYKKETVQEGRGKRSVSLCISPHFRPDASPLVLAGALPPRRYCAPHHLPSLPKRHTCGYPLMLSFPRRPSVRKSSPSWPANAQSLQPVYPPVRSVQLN